MENKKMYIYTLEDPLTKEIRYVGKTNNIEDRYRRHLQKCYLDRYDKNTHKSRWIRKLLENGNKPTMEIIEECDESNVDIREKYWISQFRCWGFNLTNISDGGEIVGHWKGRKHKEETKQKIRNSRIGKKVIEYDLEGNVIEIHECLNDASKKSGCHIFLISNCCKNKSYYTVGGKTFRYEGDEFDYIPYNKNIQKYSRKICKYDLNGKILEIFDSIREASRSIEGNEKYRTNIKSCCKRKENKKNGKFIFVKGFTWRFFDDTNGEDL